MAGQLELIPDDPAARPEDDVARFIMGNAPVAVRVDNVVPIRKGKG